MKKNSVYCLMRRAAAGILGMAVLAGSCQIPGVYAQGTADDAAVMEARQEIIDRVGNAEMKEFGEAVESGEVPRVTDADTPEGTGTTYYVDAVNGNDSSAGTSADTAWKSFEKVNSTTFEPGDRILLKAGCEWENETLNPKGSGEEGRPIILSSYGEGELPKISANGEVGDAVLLMNQEYWDISNLDISNTVEGLSDLEYIDMNDGNGSQLGDLRGLRIAGKDAGQLDGYVIHDLYVHDVTGEDRWIGGADSCAVDPDKQSTNALIQYNYIHDTGDGILLCGFGFGSAVVRYNVIQDAEKRYLNPHGDKGVNYVYNNIFYNSRETSHVPFVESSGGGTYLNKSGNMHYLYNNIFFNAAETTKTVGIGEGVSTTYDSNCYFGTAVEAPAQDGNAFEADPLFTDSSLDGAKVDIGLLTNLQLQAESPLIGEGKEIVQDAALSVDMTGEEDFFGNAVSGRRDIGTAQYQITAGGGVVHGCVTDQYGYLIEGAEVKLGELTAQTDERGYYSFGEVETGDYSLVVSKSDYDDGEVQSINVTDQGVLKKDLVLGASHSTVGVISGTVENARGGIEGVTVTASLGEESYTDVTDENGAYSIADVPAGQGYTVTAEKEGYITDVQENVSVRPGGSIPVDFILTVDVKNTEYKLNVDFDDFETGTFSGNDEWSVISPGEDRGTIEIVEEENGNKYLHMNKTASGTIAFFNKEEVSAEGIVTIEARVKRTDAGAGASNHFGGYSYI